VCEAGGFEEALALETGPDGWWYLSFAEPKPPFGRGFLGGAVVEGRGVVSAVLRAHELGINPGGEVRGIPVPEGKEKVLPCERLLSREEVEA
jgi:hypothetical protein